MNRLLPLASLVVAAVAVVIALAARSDVRSLLEEVRAREASRPAIVSPGPVPRETPGTPSSSSSSSSAPPSPAAPEAAAGEHLRALVRAVVAEELEASKSAGATEPKPPPPAEAAKPAESKEPPLSQVAAVLGITEAQREAMKEAVLRGQRDAIEMLRIPMSDGRIPLDVVFDVYLDEPEKARAREPALFALLMTEKIRGGEESYASRWEALKKRAEESFARDLTPEQFREYEKLGLDALEIDVPGSPWGDALQEVMQRRAK